MDEIEICSDCEMASANGLNGWEYTEEWLEAYNKACEWFGGEPSPTGDSEGWFSYKACDFCKSGLGGYRNSAVLLKR